MCLQNHEQLRDHDTDLICNDGDLTFMFGDTASTANGVVVVAGGSGWGSNGKKSGSTAEEALERELDSQEQELLEPQHMPGFPHRGS